MQNYHQPKGQLVFRMLVDCMTENDGNTKIKTGKIEYFACVPLSCVISNSDVCQPSPLPLPPPPSLWSADHVARLK